MGYREFTVVLIPPTFATARKIVAYSGMLGQKTAHTSPFLNPIVTYVALFEVDNSTDTHIDVEELDETKLESLLDEQN